MMAGRGQVDSRTDECVRATAVRPLAFSRRRVDSRIHAIARRVLILTVVLLFLLSLIRGLRLW
jgi:hypothetical protein